MLQRPGASKFDFEVCNSIKNLTSLNPTYSIYIKLFRLENSINLVTAKGEEKETHQSSGGSQNFQIIPGEVNQSQGISDTCR